MALDDDRPINPELFCCLLESKDSKDGAHSRSVTPIPSRSVTPRPPDGSENNFKSGMLTVRVFSGKSDRIYPAAG